MIRLLEKKKYYELKLEIESKINYNKSIILKVIIIE
jgi:hypothetical protein